MRIVMGVLNVALSVYSLLIFVRIILTWFSGARFGRPYEILAGLTDPYLYWFRRFRVFQTGTVDLSPIAALTLLSLLTSITGTLANTGEVSVGLILALILSALWSAASFVLGFFAVAVAIRLVGYIAGASVYSPFWRIIDGLARPVVYRVTSLLFRRREPAFHTGLLVSLAALVATFAVLGFVVNGLLAFFLRF